MKSSLSRHVWLIHPPEVIPTVLPIDATGGESVRFCPNWDLLCLQAFLLDRTGHRAHLLDLRLDQPGGSSLLNRIDRDAPTQAGDVAIVHTELHHLGSAAAVVRELRLRHPALTIVLSGPFPSAFPEPAATLAGIDFALSGDPENPLRHLMDFRTIEHRLRMVSGLVMPGQPPRPPHWMPDLKSVSLPQWHRVDWSAYATWAGPRGLRAEARLTRGHPGTDADLPLSVPEEPVRIWPLPAMAQTMQKCAIHGIQEVFFTDPPGCWTDDQLAAWCRQLTTLRSTQPWAFAMMPRVLPAPLIAELAVNRCRRIELIVPSPHPERRAAYGYTLDDPGLAAVINSLQTAGIRPQLRYWVHGPGETEDPTQHIRQHLAAMNFPDFSVQPFPFHPDSLLHQRIVENGGHPPGVAEWLAWAGHAQTPPPPACWAGAEGERRCRATLHGLHRRLNRNPLRRLKRLYRRMRTLSLIESFEQWIVDLYVGNNEKRR